MTATRRDVAFGLVALACTGCGATSSVPSRSLWQSVPNQGFSNWLIAFRGRARSAGVSEPTLTRALENAGYVPAVIERDRNQTEFKHSLEDYLAIAASDERIAQGRSELRKRAPLLKALEDRFGVEAQIICAIWGLESRYGERRGDVPVISALATLAYDGRRGRFFETQLIAALKILQNGDIPISRMTGSWAGAMGHTQFIPTSYQAFAVDFNSDGRRDIWSNDPSDALASAAAYLQRNGWRTGQPWGHEVRLPASYSGPLGRGTSRSVASWAAAGVTKPDGTPLEATGSASILIPSGRAGPAFLVLPNFRVLLSYNNAETYAIGVGHLSDRILGRPPVQASFPPDAFGLTLQDRKDLQRGLNRAGFNAGSPDGVVGNNTENAILQFQRANGLSATGKPSRALLDLLT